MSSPFIIFISKLTTVSATVFVLWVATLGGEEVIGGFRTSISTNIPPNFLEIDTDHSHYPKPSDYDDRRDK